MNIRNRIIEQRLVTPDEVAPNPRNWRTHPQSQRDAIRGILGQVGIAAPVIAYYSARAGNRLMLIDGHERMTVGVPFPCAILDVDDAEADTLLATFDPITAMATANNEALDALLRDVTTDSPALTQMLAELAEDAGLYADTPTITEDDVPEPPVDPITKPGDLWILGDHRLLCGDSTKAEDVERLMAGTKADACITDPPYGVSYADKNRFLNAIWLANRIEEPIENDHDDVTTTAEKLWRPAFDLMNQSMKPGAAFYVFSPQGGDQMMMMMMMAEANIPVRHELIWVKNNHVLGRADYAYKHEPVLYGWKPGAAHQYHGGFQTSLLEFDRPQKSGLHPTTKPLELVAHLMKNNTVDSNLVLDLFLGSGTTLIAAEQLGRKCYGMEISPQYCDVIVKRWETLTGKKAVRVPSKS
jgi:DNA modification methylase